jgi:hypothetical protein
MGGPKTYSAKKVFLGGTCNGSLWRNSFVTGLKIGYFNPVVENWTPEDQAVEEKEKATCDYCLYLLTPKSDSPYSIAELIDDSNKRPSKVVFSYVEKDGDTEFTPHQLKALKKIGELVERNGGKFFKTEAELQAYLNN